jgi:quinoprotein relay system zinc metallohydrolase 2
LNARKSTRHPGRELAARLVLVPLIAVALTQSAHPESLEAGELEVETASPGVYVHYGQQAEMTPANAGDVANLGFVVGERCVAVIDTGGTYALGSALHRAIRRVTALPVCYVINTHVHPDHIFGNQAFVDDAPQFVGHVRLAESMRRRGPNYLNALFRDLGATAQGTTLVMPTLAVSNVESLELGGRRLSLRAWPTAHTDTDLTVLDEATGTLWLGDLLFVEHIPVVDGSLRGFLAVIGELKTLPARQAIPGHGRAGAWPAAIVPEEAYLKRLLGDVRAALAARTPISKAVDSIDCDDAERWQLVDRFHKRNVTAAYTELEWEQ